MPPIARVLSGVTAVVMLSAHAASQEFQRTFRSGTEIVTVTATVTDARGRPVSILKQEDFSVFEEGRRQEIALFALDDRTPMSLALLADTSGSMEDKIEDVIDAIEHFLERLTADDDMAILRFSTETELVAEGSGADRDRLSRAAARLRPAGGTALYDAALAGIARVLDGRHRKKVVILLTDGNDTASDARLDDIERIVRQSEVLLYAIGIGHGERGSFGHQPLGRADTVDAATLRRLAEPSGGRSWDLEAAHKGGRDLIDAAILEIAAELRQQYTLGYYPPADRRPGTFRRLRVETRVPEYRVRARAGYWIDASPPR